MRILPVLVHERAEGRPGSGALAVVRAPFRTAAWRAALLDFTRSFGYDDGRPGFWVGELQGGTGVSQREAVGHQAVHCAPMASSQRLSSARRKPRGSSISGNAVNSLDRPAERYATSKRSVPDASAASSAHSPVSRRRT